MPEGCLKNNVIEKQYLWHNYRTLFDHLICVPQRQGFQRQPAGGEKI